MASLAEEFTASGNFRLTSVSAVVGNQNGTSPLFNVSLATNSGGVPGAVIEQIASDASYSGPPDATGFSGGLVTFNAFKKPIVLTAETSYWLVLTPADPTTVVYWDEKPSIPRTPFDVTHDPTATGGWFPFDQIGQMEIEGIQRGKGKDPVATPEPPLFVLLAIGLIGLGWRRFSIPPRRD